MDREILLAVNFEKAPAELQDAARNHAEIINSIVILETEIRECQRALAQAKADHAKSREVLDKQINEWKDSSPWETKR